jgi:phenolic acid decarboxylase
MDIYKLDIDFKKPKIEKKNPNITPQFHSGRSTGAWLKDQIDHKVHKTTTYIRAASNMNRC